jgi:hypothetical protein
VYPLRHESVVPELAMLAARKELVVLEAPRAAFAVSSSGSHATIPFQSDSIELEILSVRRVQRLPRTLRHWNGVMKAIARCTAHRPLQARLLLAQLRLCRSEWTSMPSTTSKRDSTDHIQISRVRQGRGSTAYRRLLRIYLSCATLQLSPSSRLLEPIYSWDCQSGSLICCMCGVFTLLVIDTTSSPPSQVLDRQG